MSTFNCYRSLLLSLALVTLAACGAGEIGADTSDGNDSDDTALTRADAVSRAEQWVGAKLQYCQSPNHARDYDSSCSQYCTRTDSAAWDPYRSDCSGLVSWSWGLPSPGRTTLMFAPFMTDLSAVIAASALQPGDAVNNADHVMLFKQWVVQGQVATFIEEPGCSASTPYAHEFTSNVFLDGNQIHVAWNGMTFWAIRYGGITTNPPTVTTTPTAQYRGLAHDATGRGYWIVGSDGGIFTFGDAGFYGSTGAIKLNQPIVGMAATPDSHGYWLVASDGGVFTFGNAPYFGSTGGIKLNQPIVGMAPMPDGSGYWLVASDGGVFSFGRAKFYGSTGAIKLNQPVVGMAATPTGLGYWLVAADGGIFAFGDAKFFGSTGAIKLNQPVVGMAATPSGKGYWLVAADGGIFAFGDAGFHGSTGAIKLASPVIGMAATPSGNGYWLVAGDGGVFTFGDAIFAGSRAGK